MLKSIMRLSVRDWYNVRNVWEERFVECEIIKKDLEIKVIGKIIEIIGNIKWEVG